MPAAISQDGPAGITSPTTFAVFDPAASTCAKPAGLTRHLAFVQENDREFLEGVSFGLKAAAADRDMPYDRAVVDNDDGKATSALNAFANAKTGAVIVTASNPDAVRAGIQRTIWGGSFVGTIGPAVATLLLNAPQYQTGKVLGDAAAGYIDEKLAGKADVVIFTQDGTQYLAPRFRAMRDVLRQIPGVTVIADLAPSEVTEKGGYDAMQTILSAGVNVDVVLGADSEVLGALRALREAHKDRPDQFLGGIDGEPDAVAEIQAGNGPYKASVALSSPVFGFAMGEYAADWLDGKSVPQAMDILPIALTHENIRQYEADLADPGAVFRDPNRREHYLKMYGNICFDSRDQYVNFPWSSEPNK